ncbi:MAG: PD-(D/E)XK nuclease family protein [Patescibacteria group bacterium]
MPYNPNLVYISHSKIGDFSKCPQLYFLRSVYKDPKTRYKMQIITPALALGSIVHDILDSFLNNEPSERTNILLYNTFKSYWKNIEGEKGGFLTEDTEKEYKERAIKMLKNFFDTKDFLFKKRLKTSTFPKYDLGKDMVVNGKLDWVEMDGDYFHIVDFKTGRNEEKDNSLQMPIYSLLVQNEFKTEKIKSSYWYLDSSPTPILFNLPEKEKTLSELIFWGERIKLAHETSSFRCKSGGDFCWACKDFVRVKNGEGKIVSVDHNRSQNIYILKDENRPIQETESNEALPF